MIIHNEGTLEEAVALVRQEPVRYSDYYAYRIVSSEELLRNLSLQALSRGDVAVVVLVGQEGSMEGHPAALKRIKAQRRETETQAVRAWVRAHPEVKKAQTTTEILRIIHGRAK